VCAHGQTAADIVHVAIKKLVELSVEGAKVLDLCQEGDKLIEAGTAGVYNKSVKGVKTPKGRLPLCNPFNARSDHFTVSGLAFPTAISVNNCVAHFTPLP